MKKYNWPLITIAALTIVILFSPAITSALAPPRPDRPHVPAIPTVPIGGVVLWPHSLDDIPAGYILCKDLVGVFIVGAGGEYALGDTGGEAFTETIHDHQLLQSPARHVAAGKDYTNATNPHQSITDNRPPYKAVYFIMRVK